MIRPNRPVAHYSMTVAGARSHGLGLGYFLGYFSQALTPAPGGLRTPASGVHGAVIMGRHPQTFTLPEMATPTRPERRPG
jgi:hypothetical protein